MFAVNESNTVITTPPVLRRSPRFLAQRDQSFITPEKTKIEIPSIDVQPRKKQKLNHEPVLLVGTEFFKKEPEEDKVLKSINVHLLAVNVNNINQRYSEIIKVYEIFNDNIELLKKINKPYNELKPLSSKAFKFDILFRRLFKLSEFLIKRFKAEKSVENIIPFTGMSSIYINKLKLISLMNVTREKFHIFRHIHFDD